MAQFYGVNTAISRPRKRPLYDEKGTKLLSVPTQISFSPKEGIQYPTLGSKSKIRRKKTFMISSQRSAKHR